jgi:hypothetical protein
MKKEVKETQMTITVSRSQGIQYCIGQPLYFGGQWLRIDAKFPITEKGLITSYAVVLSKPSH